MKDPMKPPVPKMSDEDGEELKYLRVKTRELAIELERLKTIEKQWLADRERGEEI